MLLSESVFNSIEKYLFSFIFFWREAKKNPQVILSIKTFRQHNKDTSGVNNGRKKMVVTRAEILGAI